MLLPMAAFLATVLVLSAAGCTWFSTLTVHPIVVGEIEFDPSTLHTIGLSVPVLAGDENFSATVHVSYRRIGDSAWREALPLQRVRPETVSRLVPSPFPIKDQFAGSIFDLQAGSMYEIVLTIRDAGGNTTRTGQIATRPLSLDNPASPHVVTVETDEALTAAVADAKPGDVIVLSDGRFKGPIRVERSGTAKEPIVLRGAGHHKTAIESPGAEYGVLIAGAHIHLEDLAIRSSAWGIKLANVSDVVVQRLHIADVSYGIDARSGTNRDLYICDNLLEGTGVTWPDTSSRTWDYEGIVVTGAGHVVCYNTVAGFGDALGLSQPRAIPNRAMDFYGNDVLWGGDDGIELDYGERNVRAFRNRFGNTGMGISFQPVWGGPVYAFRNVIYNTATAPYKLNQDPSGFYILHNTSLRPGWAWLQYGDQVSNFVFQNNLTIGTDKAVSMKPFIHFAQIDYNGWSPDGEFKFDFPWNDFSSLRQKSPYEQHGRLLTQPVFDAPLAVPAQFSLFMKPPPDVTLHRNSNALDAGVRVPNINDDYTGVAPDLGALERGREAPRYGARWLTGDRHTPERTAAQ